MRKVLVVIFFLIFSGHWLHAQEKVIYPAKTHTPRTLKTTQNEPVELPFTDDFAYPGQAPDPALWADSGVYINNSYGANPPTIGVATLDAVNREGEVYENAGYGDVFQADQLASRPVNLNYPGDRTVFLSFYYQPQGLADAPEPRDSLLVDFYSPVSDSWHTQWSKAGAKLQEFKLVMLPVDEERFLKEGFRFRFRNYASLTGSDYPDEASNCDHWHIDYVHLNINRNENDTVFRDLAFVNQLTSLLSDYEAVPWEHYKAYEEIEFRNASNLVYRNLDTDDRLIDSMKFFINNTRMPGSSTDIINAGAYNVPASSENTFIKPLGYQFPRNKKQTASFEITARLVTDDFDRKANNEATFNQHFFHDYAYDDGTSEAGYGLSGEGTKYGLVAYKFYTYKKDTLRGVKMYFNSTLKDYNQDMYFYLKVWDHENGLPGRELYSKTNYQPDVDSLNRYQTYSLKSYQNDLEDTAIIVQDTFYIGWMQTTNDMMNVGIDFNRESSNKLYYNIRGLWKESQIEGALMMRPVFGPEIKVPAAIDEVEEQGSSKTLKLYPNPAARMIKGQIASPHPVDAVIFNASGREVWRGRLSGHFRIPVRQWPEGFYVLRARSSKQVITGKFLIAR